MASLLSCAAIEVNRQSKQEAAENFRIKEQQANETGWHDGEDGKSLEDREMTQPEVSHSRNKSIVGMKTYVTISEGVHG